MLSKDVVVQVQELESSRGGYSSSSARAKRQKERGQVLLCLFLGEISSGRVGELKCFLFRHRG